MNELRKCSKCAISKIHETINFVEYSVCNICRQNEAEKERLTGFEEERA